MPSVLLSVFLLQLFIHLLNTIGKQRINDLLWSLYTKLPTPQSKDGDEITRLRSEVVRLNREMKATSSQDEFAKWARLRRQHDKAKDKYDEKTKGQESTRGNFYQITNIARWLGTQGLQFFCNTWYSKQPMFWLPQGWVPYSVEWVLSFPRAPVGSISVNVWAIACAAVVAMASEALVGVWTLRTGVVQKGPRKGEKIMLERPMEMGSAGGGMEKKEL